MDFRRQWSRPLKTWQLVVPGQAERIDPLGGLLDYAQGDTPIWFDGADTVEVVEPILIGIGNGNTVDFILPHRHVFVATTVIYLNNAPTNAWGPLGGDGVVMDMIRFTSAPFTQYQIKAKYRRKCKVVVSFNDSVERNRAFRNSNNATQSVYEQRFLLEEVPT